MTPVPDFEGPIALLHRPSTTGPDVMEILRGRVTLHETLTGVEAVRRDAAGPDGAAPETLLVVPFRQARERGFAVQDDGCPLVALHVDSHREVPVRHVLDELPLRTLAIEGRFEPDRATYAARIRHVIDEEIGQGEGSNFVLKRSFIGQIADYDRDCALSVFRRLLEQEDGTYWTFLVDVGDRVFVGASPEQHVSSHGGTAAMNPISGTYRYPPEGPDVDGVQEFLHDRKETDELTMVVDEELKIMAGICDSEIRVTGPELKQMSRLAHTEYHLLGHTESSAVDILRETLFAPTVVGSPLRNAFRVTSRREDTPRRYYSGCLALLGTGPDGHETLDSAILIRTAEIDPEGRVDIGVGATLVRHSDPDSEVAETESKAAGLLGVFTGDAARREAQPARAADLAASPAVAASLAERNTELAPFWFGAHPHEPGNAALFWGQQVIVLDCEDSFTQMLAYQLRSLRLDVTVRDVRDEGLALADLAGYDLVVLGPGPGDPRASSDPKIARMHEVVRHVLAERMPLLAVCLGHQVLCVHLGLQVVRLPEANQGTQRQITLFGEDETVGFYNTFVATSRLDRIDSDGLALDVARDVDTGRVHALRAQGVRSMQFHPESILTADGVELMAAFVGELLPVTVAGSP